jgi:gamma-glutamylcyclotransferase (GGCT)/AIG2-like uncharacterized protein YtfP
MPTKYFANGSNMSNEEIEGARKSVRFVSTASLEGYRLAFTWKSSKRGGDVADSVVWGVLYEIEDDDLGGLDLKEGYRGEGQANIYDRNVVEVTTDQNLSVCAMSYEMRCKYLEEYPPGPEYLSTILTWSARSETARRIH